MNTCAAWIWNYLRCDFARICVQTFSPMNFWNCWARLYALTCIYTRIRFQWIRGLSLKQLKKTHTCTHSWFIFIASHKLAAGHWQSAFVQPAITAWHRANIYGEPAGQDDSGGARAARSPKSRAERPSPPPPPAQGDCSLDSEHLCYPRGLDLPVLSTPELPSLCQPGFPQSLGNLG